MKFIIKRFKGYSPFEEKIKQDIIKRIKQVMSDRVYDVQLNFNEKYAIVITTDSNTIIRNVRTFSDVKSWQKVYRDAKIKVIRTEKNFFIELNNYILNNQL